MSLNYADIKTAMGLVIKNSPSVKIRGAVHNINLTNVLQHSRDRMADKTISLAGLADNYEIYYDLVAGIWKVRKSKHHESFDNSDLSSGVLTVVHELLTYTPNPTVYDENNKLVNVFGITTRNGLSEILIDFGGSISGTWRISVER